MLKRMDLVQQFENVVKQEILNYQNSLNMITTSLNDLEKSIIEIRKDLAVIKAQSESETKKLEINIQNINIDLMNLGRRFNALSSDFDSQDKEITNHYRSLSYQLQDQCKDNEKNREYIIKNEAQIDSAHQRIDSLECHITNQFSDLLWIFRKELENAKNEILSRPSDSIELKKEFDDKIQSYRLDVEGVLKEVRFAHKSLFITEKKIENIYTLIERLTKLVKNESSIDS